MDEHLAGFRARLTEAIVGACTTGVSPDDVAMALAARLMDYADLPEAYRQAVTQWREATEATDDRYFRAFNGIIGKLLDAADKHLSQDEIVLTLAVYVDYGINLNGASRVYLEERGKLIRQALEGIGEVSRESYRDN